MLKPSLKFLIPSHFVPFNLLQAMGPKNVGGGVALKYARIEEAGHPDFVCKRISSVTEVDPGDIVFADWMWFCVFPDDDKESAPIDQVKAFVELPNRKIIYGSEFCVCTLPRNLIGQAIDGADMILHNCQHLRRLYRAVGIFDSRFLCDPIPQVFTPSILKTRKVVCVGLISEAKNTQAAASLFEQLKGTGVETVFIGGKSLWGEGP